MRAATTRTAEKRTRPQQRVIEAERFDAGASLQPDNVDFPSALIASNTDMHLIGRIVYTLREFRPAKAPAPEPVAASQRSARSG